MKSNCRNVVYKKENEFIELKKSPLKKNMLIDATKKRIINFL